VLRNPRFLLPALAFDALLLVSLWAGWSTGSATSWLPWLATSPWGAQVSLDFVLAMVVVSGFILQDARERGVNGVPWVVATLTTGSFGPLAYLMARAWQEQPATDGVGAGSVRVVGRLDPGARRR